MCRLPQQGGDLFGTAPTQESIVKALLELQAAPGDASSIAGLPGLPAVLISRLEFGSRIPGLSGFEFSVFGHSICSMNSTVALGVNHPMARAAA
jgi:hypothetical protein